MEIGGTKTPNTPLEWEEDAKESWKCKLERHESRWESLPFKKDDLRCNQALDELDHHLDEYEDFPAFSQENGPLIERGNLRPKILFILSSPTYYDYKSEKVFSLENRDFLKQQLSRINIDDEDCHFAYIFPWTLERGVEIGDFERELLLPYIRRRIYILRPRMIVCMGQKTKEFISSAFSMRPTQNKSIRTTHEDSTDRYKLEIEGFQTQGLFVPHPFSIRITEDEDDTRVVWWNASLKMMNATFNPMQYSGRKFIDTRGFEKRDVTQFLKSQSKDMFTELERKKRKRPIDSKERRS